MRENHLEVQKLCCIRQQKRLFSDLTFELKPGEILLVQGPNGSGKSSLLRLLSSLSAPNEGDILWQGHSIRECRTQYVSELHYLGHSNGLKLGLNVIENLQLAGKLTSDTLSNKEEVLSLFELDRHKDTIARFLSAGQRRRLALARLWLIRKPLWILDEPLVSLDTEAQSFFLKQLATHLANRGLCILSSHQPLKLQQLELKELRLHSC